MQIGIRSIGKQNKMANEQIIVEYIIYRNPHFFYIRKTINDDIQISSKLRDQACLGFLY